MYIASLKILTFDYTSRAIMKRVHSSSSASYQGLSSCKQVSKREQLPHLENSHDDNRSRDTILVFLSQEQLGGCLHFSSQLDERLIHESACRFQMTSARYTNKT
jgi:hypothetical protein